jgi:hypothetical protein
MKAAEILERLEAARIAITALPKDTEILTVQVDGLSTCGITNHDYIHISTPFEVLVEASVIKNGCWKTKDDPTHESVEESFWIKGFRIVHIKDKGAAASGVTSTEGGKDGQQS